MRYARVAAPVARRPEALPPANTVRSAGRGASGRAPDHIVPLPHRLLDVGPGDAPIQRMPFEKIIPHTWYNLAGIPQPMWLFSKDSIGRQFIFFERANDSSSHVIVVENENDVLSYHRDALPQLKERFNVLPRLDKSAFDAAVVRLGAVGVAEDISKHGEYDTARGFEKSIYTAEMDTCITVGFTARTTTSRINVLLHSMETGRGVVGDIFGQLDSVLGKIEARFGKPEDVRYYVVGGNAHPASVQKATEILQHLLVNDLPVEGIALPTGADERDLMKGVLITSEGEIRYTSYRPPEPEKQPTTTSTTAFGGFGGFGKASSLLGKK